MTDTTSIPAFLVDLVRKYGGQALVGEWDLAVLLDAPRFTMERLQQEIDRFLTAFPWARVRRFRTVAVDSDGSETRITAVAWPANLGAQLCGGAELELDLDLAWVSPEGVAGRSWLGPAGRLVIEHPDGSSPLFCTFSVSVNLFTDEAHDGAGGVLKLEPAAADNRRALTRALRAWAEATGGQIVSCDSYVLEEGAVEPWGIADGARAMR